MKNILTVCTLVAASSWLLAEQIKPNERYISNSPIGEYNVDPDKSTTGAKGDNGVYKGYAIQRSTAVLPATVKTTTTHTTNYRYVAPPPPPPPSGGGADGGSSVGGGSTPTPTLVSWDNERIVLETVNVFGLQSYSASSPTWSAHVKTIGHGHDGEYTITGPCGQTAGFVTDSTRGNVNKTICGVTVNYIGRSAIGFLMIPAGTYPKE